MLGDVLGGVRRRRRKSGRDDDDDEMTSSSDGVALRILDPTCGSGTFLALSLLALGGDGMRDDDYDAESMIRKAENIVEVTGIDSNVKCAHGTMRNLLHLFPHHQTTDDEDDIAGNVDRDDVDRWTINLPPSSLSFPSRARIYAGDSSNIRSFVPDGLFDCAIMNLPWNRNTFEYRGGRENDDDDACSIRGILESTAEVLKPGSPLMVVSGGHRDHRSRGVQQANDMVVPKGTPFDIREFLEGIGFIVVGEASIPPRGFRLPVSGKMRDVPGPSAKDEKVSRNSDCSIIVAIAPPHRRKM
jgi:hypothetical protein